MARLARPGGSPPTPRSVDVARLADVSQKTVSRVLNDEPYVSADVRRRVLDAAAELGYRRNQAARALASGRTRSIGVVTLGTALYGPASLLMGIERAVREVGYTLRLANTIEGDPGGIAGALASLLDQGVDGVVISEPIDEGVGLISVDVPVLVLGASPTFAGPQVVTARRGPARAGRDRAPAGVGARDRPSPGRPAAVVFGTGPYRRLARGAASPRRGRAAGRRGRLVGRVRLRGGPGTGRRRHRDRGVRRERRHGVRSHPRAARGRAPGARGHQRRRVRRHPGRRLRHSSAHHRAAAVRRGRAAGPRAASTRHREAGRRASTGGRPTGRARRPRLDGATTAPADPGTWPPSDPPCPRWPARSARRQRSPIHPALISVDLSTYGGTSPEARTGRR